MIADTVRDMALDGGVSVGSFETCHHSFVHGVIYSPQFPSTRRSLL